MKAAHHQNPGLKLGLVDRLWGRAGTTEKAQRQVRGQISRASESQIAEEAAIHRRMLGLLAIQTLNGRRDAEDMAAALMTMLRGRTRLPGGNLVATMALATQFRRSLRRRVRKKKGAPGGRRWSKGLHPGLWSSPDSGLFESYPPPQGPRQLMTGTEIGVVAIR